MCIWQCGSILISYTRVAGSSHFTVMTNIFVSEFTEFTETFRENSTKSPNLKMFQVDKVQKQRSCDFQDHVPMTFNSPSSSVELSCCYRPLGNVFRGVCHSVHGGV